MGEELVYMDSVAHRYITHDELVRYLTMLDESMASVRRSIDFWEVNSQIDYIQAVDKLTELINDHDVLERTITYYRGILKGGPIDKQSLA